MPWRFRVCGICFFSYERLVIQRQEKKIRLQTREIKWLKEQLDKLKGDLWINQKLLGDKVRELENYKKPY